MTIEVLKNNPFLLNQVVELGTINSKTLGHFPEGAFIEHHAKGNIIVAHDDNNLLGYILFAITHSKRIIRITHLCISEESRKLGIANMLLTNLRDRYANLLKGMSLSCREDYDVATKFWEQYGFKPIGRRRSRSKKENFLLTWWYDFGNEDLFSISYENDNLIKAVLDANILIKLRDEDENDTSGTKFLMADWLDDVDYYFAPEIFNEINRDEDKSRAEQTRKFIRNFSEPKIKPNFRDYIFEEVKNIVPGSTINDISDKKQLAECIAAEIKYFITTDENILNNNEALYDRYAVHAIRPTDFILMVDQQNNKGDYYSARLAGVSYDYKPIQSREIDNLVETFLSKAKGEKKHHFRDKLTSLACNVKNAKVKVVQDKNGVKIGAWGGELNSNEVVISFIRTVNNVLSYTLFKQLINSLINFTISKNKNYLKINENYLRESEKSVLESYGFLLKTGSWIKLVDKGIVNSLDYFTANNLTENIFDNKIVLNKLLQGDINYKVKIERLLFPLKFEDLNIPTYIIPIKPYWAGQLFDFFIAGENLFGAKAELSWSRENIYYRSVKPVSEQVPARILWYSSSSKPNSPCSRESSIIGCSYIDSVNVDKPKNLYKKFKNFGIYEWKDVYKLAKNDIENYIKALEFSDTEVFKKPIGLKKINEILLKNGRKSNTFPSPLEVNCDIFNEIYKLGIEN